MPFCALRVGVSCTLTLVPQGSPIFPSSLFLCESIEMTILHQGWHILIHGVESWSGVEPWSGIFGAVILESMQVI